MLQMVRLLPLWHGMQLCPIWEISAKEEKGGFTPRGQRDCPKLPPQFEFTVSTAQFHFALGWLWGERLRRRKGAHAPNGRMIATPAA